MYIRLEKCGTVEFGTGLRALEELQKKAPRVLKSFDA
jgi:hypothetical protein